MTTDYGVTKAGLMFEVDKQGRPVIADGDLAEMSGEEIQEGLALAAKIHLARPATDG